MEHAGLDLPDLEVQPDSEVEAILPARELTPPRPTTPEKTPGGTETLVQELVEQLCRRRPPPDDAPPPDEVVQEAPVERKTSIVGAFFLVAFLITWATLD